MPDTMMKLWQWTVCSLCSGDGVANMVADPEGNVEEGECPKCGGLGHVKTLTYLELNLTQLRDFID